MTEEKSKKWILDVQEDEEGNAIIQFPPDLLELSGWESGDILKWTELGNGAWSLTKSEIQETTPEEEEAWRELEQRLNKK